MSKKELATLISFSVICAIVGFTGPLNAQVDIVSTIPTLAQAENQYLPPIDRLYNLDLTGISADVQTTYTNDPEGAIGAAIKAMWEADADMRDMGVNYIFSEKIFAAIQSVYIEEARHYVDTRLAERNVTIETDPKFFEYWSYLQNNEAFSR